MSVLVASIRRGVCSTSSADQPEPEGSDQQRTYYGITRLHNTYLDMQAHMAEYERAMMVRKWRRHSKSWHDTKVGWW